MSIPERKSVSWIVAGTIVLAVAALAYFARPAYRHFREKQTLASAKAFFKQGDYRNAILSARQTLLINSNDAAACRIMADINGIIRSPAELDWRTRVVEIEPSVENKLLLAEAGLTCQSPPYPLTSQILDGLPASADSLPLFQKVSAEMALKQGRLDAAAAHFEEAFKLEPTNLDDELDFEELHLFSTNATVVAAARLDLQKFSADTNLALTALRFLTEDRLRNNDLPAALNYSEALLKMPGVATVDRLEHIVILRRLNHPQAAAQLAQLQSESVTNAVMVNQVVSWMEANGLRDEAIRWLTNQPAAFISQTPVRLALVDCYLNNGNWTALRKFLSEGDWGDQEYSRLAYLSLSWRHLGESLVADGDWRAAVNASDDRLSAWNELFQLAKRWDMEPQEEDLLWRIVQKFPEAGWAGDSLARLYLASGNTAGLRQLYSQLLSASPDDTRDKNNLALTSMLLKTNLNQAFGWAAAAYTQEPDAVTASTYAYALLLQNRTRDGLAVLQKLPAGDLEQPSVALYYGVLLAADGQTNAAAHFLDIAAAKSDGFLPEEKNLPGQYRSSR